MEKDGVIKAVSVSLAALLSATACSSSSPANPNTSPPPEPSMQGRYVAVGAQCSLYTLGVKNPIWPRVYDPVIETKEGALGPDGISYLYSCTKAAIRVPVGECQIVPSIGALTCNRIDNQGTIYGSKVTPSPRGDFRAPERAQRYRAPSGAGWSATRYN